MSAKLTKRQLDALDECVRYADRKQSYWWRRSSMMRLAELGLTKRITHDGTNRRLDTYEPTEAGRAALQAARGGQQ